MSTDAPTPMAPTTTPAAPTPIPVAPAPPAPALGGHLAHSTVDSPIGPLTVLASAAGVRAVLWPGEDGSRIARSLAGGAKAPSSAQATTHAERAANQLAQYFAGQRREFDVALDLVGTQFQLSVWRALLAIPYGTTASYRQQAELLGDPAKARAVGAADGRNPVSIIVPCHRVVASGGSLTGFAGGLDTKAWLLDHERAVLANTAAAR